MSVHLDNSFATLLGHLRGADSRPDHRDELFSSAVFEHLLDHLIGPLTDELSALAEICDTVLPADREDVASRCTALAQQLQEHITSLHPYLPLTPTPSQEELTRMQAGLSPWVLAEEVIATTDPRAVLNDGIHDLESTALLLRSPEHHRPRGIGSAPLLRSIAADMRDIRRLIAASPEAPR